MRDSDSHRPQEEKRWAKTKERRFTQAGAFLEAAFAEPRRGGILALSGSCCICSDPHSHAGSFFGNAIATGPASSSRSWQQSGSSKRARRKAVSLAGCTATEPSSSFTSTPSHSFWSPDSAGSICSPGSIRKAKWGTVVSNIVSEWSQQIGLVLLTKKLIEPGSKESHDEAD